MCFNFENTKMLFNQLVEDYKLNAYKIVDAM